MIDPPKALHILFVDDDSDESYLFNEALEHIGLTVNLSRAIDGNDLLKFLKHNTPPDLIFMDLNMPYKDGLEALAEIRSNEAFANLPIVIYSTTRNAVFMDACYEKGANLFVIKPNNFDGMVEVVNKVCLIDWKVLHEYSREEFVLKATEL